MGGRGGHFEADKEIEREDTWEWLKDVETKRLKKYIKRSKYLENQYDPQGRSIHDVGFWAQKELNRRGI